MTHEWITDRLPTKADTDKGFIVKVPHMPGEVPPTGCYQRYSLTVPGQPSTGCYQHYSLIVPGQPWWSYVAAQRVEVKPEPAISFAVGQQWRRRSGEVVTVTEVDPGTGLPVCVEGESWHRADGTSCVDLSELDLIELVSGPEPAPARTRKVDQFVTAGDDLFARCDDGTMWTLGHRGWTQLPAIPQPTEPCLAFIQKA